MQHALIVEDLPHVREWLGSVLKAAFPQVQVSLASRRATALRCVAEHAFDLALIDLDLPDGSGVDVVGALHHHQPRALPVVVTIYDDDAHLFPALQAGAFGYLLKDQPTEVLVAQLLRLLDGEPQLSPPIARRVLAHFANGAQLRTTLLRPGDDAVHLTERETEVLQRVAKGYTLLEIAQQFGLSRHTVDHYIKQVYRKLNVSSRAEATLEAARRGLVHP
jgi:DNA-binding NarL/FixJ family response regulator